MASLSERLKAVSSTIASTTSIEGNVTMPTMASADMMTLEESYNGLAYSGEETWTLSKSYKSTDGNIYGERYEDDNYSVVDITKTISINQNQINLTQEDNSQYIPFEMFRYYDGIDLMTKTLSIYYLNKEYAEGTSTPINVRYSDTKIRFGWVVPKEATALDGKLRIEIHAEGTNPLGGKYLFKTRPNEEIEILKSLQGNGNVIIDENWASSVLEDVQQAAIDAQSASLEAQRYAEYAQNALATVESKISDASNIIASNVKSELETTTLKNYYTKSETYSRSEVDKKIEDIDISEDLKSYALKTEIPTNVSELTNDAGYLTEHQSLEDYALKTDLTGLATEDFVKDEVAKVDVSEQLKDYAKIENVYNKQEVDNKIANVKVDLTGYATETYVTGITDTLRTDVNTNIGNIQTINTAISTINQTLDSIDKSPNAYYVTTYNEPYTIEGVEYTGENTLAVYEIINKDKENETRTVVSSHVIVGGSGGSGSANIIKIERITNTPLVVTSNDKVIIEYTFIGTDSSGDDLGQGKATWKVGSSTVKTESIYTGDNEVDLTEYIGVGSDQKITLIITDDVGTVQQKTWYVSVVDVKLESTFDDTRKYSAGSTVGFTYTPYGAVDKTVHILMDGEEIDTVTSSKSAAGLSTSYTLPAQDHGTHLIEIYMTATINNNDIESNHIVKDIIWYDENSDVPVISTVKQNFTARQYAATNIVYTVYDPSTETPTVNLKATYVNELGETVEEYSSTVVMSTNTETWQYKTDVIGEHILTITCGETVKTLTATITELGIEVSPTIAGLEFDFNPVGYSNNDTNRVWSDANTGVTMTVSDNFDWVNGGYQIDEAGDQYFCIKAGTTAVINYNLFADDAKENGKEFKAIFKTTNVKKRDTSFISCMDNGIGIDMKVESANIYSSNDSLYSPYCEEDIIEFEFNINKNTDIPMVLTYEDGVGNRPMIYTSDSSFWQTSPQPITIGSENCDVHIYRMKAYSTSLSDKDILNNFIADARSAEEMIARYERNQIYKEGVLDPEYLAEKCPDLRIILVDAPWFTNDKDNKVDDTNVTMIYKNGDPILDNWTCTGARHSGQGTSSNEYGYAGRNIDLIMDTDTSLFTLGDGVTTSKTITLTRSSVPTDYLNVKVNIASSENQNNAQMARRYNQFNPFVRSAKFNDSNVKDTMEFYNCIIFVKERNEDISTHREFLDTNYHYYALGNVGDSKKTDDTRVNNKKDPKECIVEITDYNVTLAEFPTGYGESGKEICPVSEWKPGNAAYDFLYADYKYKDGKFKSFGSESYEFRYEMKNITEEQRQVNIDNWREMYKFVVTSTDSEFYARLKEYFVINSALYFYLFTERYTMVDNRAKNSFWHYGKVYITKAEATTLEDGAGAYIIDDEQAALHEGYRWDLTQGYDFDTSLGIDNTGKLVLTYGKEDVDYYVDGDSESGYIYRAAESTFFSRLRDLFKSEMQAMFIDRENVNAWSSSGLIKQWDDAQSQFPEEIWRLDIERKYLRTYLGKSIDNSIAGEANPRFLTTMLNGRKKYQRRMFERNQELYMATKYFGKVATQDQIMMRFNNPVGASITPDFTLYITPYSDMYIGTSFGNVTPTNFRAKAGIEYSVPCSIESGTADITLIYGASFIQAIGDLSRCYVGDNDFSKASRLQSLVIGSNTNGYSNAFMTKISLGNNKLLEYLDIRNIVGLNSVVDLSQCANLLELYAQGSGATGVIFANGGKLEKAYIPAITSLTMKNLNYIKEFVVESYNKLQTLVVEHSPFVDTHEIVNSSPILNVLRLVGIDWNIKDTNVLKKLMLLRGISNTGGEIGTSVLTGSVFVPIIRQQELKEFNETWLDLDINYNTFIEQYPVTFVNEDGTVLDVQHVSKGEYAVDPITRAENPINIPTKPSTISTNYTFNGWDTNFSKLQIFEPQTITAVYSESIRQYGIQYMSMGKPLSGYETPVMGNYGENITYSGSIPTYTDEEGGYKYYLFNRWDKSGILDGGFNSNNVKVVNAVFDSFQYTSSSFNGKDLTDLTPVEIYAMNKLGLAESIITNKDPYTIVVGNDVDYDDIESELLISDGKCVIPGSNYGKSAKFKGSSYIDTGIKLFKEDKDFVLAIDYEFIGSQSNTVLAQCFQVNGSNGFKLWYNSSGTLSGVNLTWGTTADRVVSLDKREVIILRHKKGENNLTIYKSNLDGNSVLKTELSRTKNTIGDCTLVFGASNPEEGYYEDHAIGNVHWAKIWYKDLGEDVCKTLAEWSHESVTLEACGFRRYFLSDNPSKRCSFSLLASHLLSRAKKWNETKTNDGGWAASSLNRYLNTRLYNAIPIQIRSLLKQVIVYSNDGIKNTTVSPAQEYTEVLPANCYIAIPSLIEVDPTQTTEPYNSEGTTISFLNSNDSRIRRRESFSGYIDGTVDDYQAYWLRSPAPIIYSSNYTDYVWRVEPTGVTQGVTSPNTEYGILIMISF